MFRRRRFQNPGRVERLEDRCLLAADPVISEIMARNDSTLLDGDGSWSDWVEIYNPGSEVVDLAGWYLTDDDEQLTRWSFPAQTLDPGAYLVVFASGQETDDYVDAEGNLHTNFRLAGDGEFLALVKPDGRTIASGFAPRFPGQLDDISFGSEFDATATNHLIAADSAARTLIPSRTVSDWTQIGFDDTEWQAGSTSLGFERRDGAALPDDVAVHFAFDEENPSSTALETASQMAQGVTGSSEFVVGRFGNALDFDGTTHIDLQAKPQNLRDGFTLAAWIQPDENNRTIMSSLTTNLQGGFWFGYNNGGPWLGIAAGAAAAPGSTGRWTNVSAPHTMDQLGRWYHVAVTFDPTDTGQEVKFFIDGAQVSDVSNADLADGQMGDAAAADFRIGLHNADSFPFDGRMDDVVVFDRPLAVTDVFDLSQAGVLTEVSFDDLIQTDVGQTMRGVNASLLTRVPFNVSDPGVFDRLKLRMMYDDGFIAYINGIEVARSNAPLAPVWNSAATAERNDRQARSFVEFDLSQHLGALQVDANVLAIQGLNLNADDGDFLLVSELLAEQTETVTRYFPEPTPGAANSAGVDGFVADVSVSAGRGFYDQPIDVSISTDTADAQIRYTIDGSAPSAATGLVYRGPITIESTTTLRAAAFKDRYLASPVSTNTYVYLDQIIRQPNDPAGAPDTWGEYRIGQPGRPVPADYEMNQTIINSHADTIIDDLKSLPTMSIVMDPVDLFGDGNVAGIYTDAFMADDIRERATSIEWFQADGERELQIDAGIRLFGGWSRHFWATPKKSFALKFKRPFGPTKLDFPLFAENQVDSKLDPTEEFDTVLLRAVFSDAWPEGASPPQYLRDLNARYAQLAMGQPSSHGTWVHLYLNGIYWGIYNPSERPDASFMASYFGGDKDEYDTVKHTGLCGPGCASNNSFEVVDGGEEARRGFQDALDLARRGLPDSESYQRFKEMVDVENLADYIILQHYIGNVDWPHKNWYASRQREGGEGWQFFVWDSEYTLRGTSDSQVTANSPNNPNTPAALFDAARRNQEFLDLFADRVQKHLFNDGVLQPEANIARYQALADQVEGAIKAEAARWGDNGNTRQGRTNYTFSRWESVKNSIIRTYFPRRHSVAIRQLRSAGLYPDIEAPTLNQFGGQVDAGFQLEISVPEGTIYYTLNGSDPRDEARNPSGSVYRDPVALMDSGVVKTRAFHDGQWSALTEAAFEVIGGDFIVLQNGVEPELNYAGMTDSQLRESTPQANLGEQPTLVVSGDDPTGSQQESIALLRWDVSGIPAHKVVESASITLSVEQATGGQYDLFAVRRDWSENQTNWLESSLGQSWQVAGARGRGDRGLPSTTVSLIDLNRSARMLVPIQPVDAWTATDFDDANWSAVQNGVGYEVAGDPLVPGLAAAWQFNESNPTASVKNLGNGRDDAVTGVANFVEGRHGNALEFDGDTHIDVTSSAAEMRDGFSIAAWIKPEESDRTIVSRINAGVPNRGFWFGYNQGGPWLGIAAGASQADGATGKWTNVSAPGAMETLGQWFHVAVTFDPGDTAEEVKFYVNGSRLTQGVTGANLADGWMGDPSETLARIGRHNSGAFPFDGLMDELVIFDRPLSSEQVGLLMDQPDTAISGAPLQGLIESDVVAELRDVNTSAYLRFPFDVAEPSYLDGLTLEVRYDDAFVAYLNGVEISRRNTSAAPVWNSVADTSREAADVLGFEAIDVREYLGELREGENVLAVQALNVTRNDNDFFFQAKLTGVTEAASQLGAIGPTGQGLASVRLNRAGVDLVQSWIDGSVENDGLAISAAEPGDDLLVFHSSEVDTPSLRPRLMIRFSEQTPAGDFNQDGRVDAQDIHALCLQIQQGNHTVGFDLSGDGLVDDADRDRLIFDVMRSTYGDANLDGVFDSRDFVQVFQAGKYEDGLPQNANWTDGDWDCDGDFGSSDLVLAFRTGAYTAAARIADAVFRSDNVARIGAVQNGARLHAGQPRREGERNAPARDVADTAAARQVPLDDLKTRDAVFAVVPDKRLTATAAEFSTIEQIGFQD